MCMYCAGNAAGRSQPEQVQVAGGANQAPPPRKSRSDTSAEQIPKGRRGKTQPDQLSSDAIPGEEPQSNQNPAGPHPKAATKRSHPTAAET